MLQRVGIIPGERGRGGEVSDFPLPSKLIIIIMIIKNNNNFH